MELSKVKSMRQEPAQPQEPAQGQTLHLGGGNIWLQQSCATSQIQKWGLVDNQFTTSKKIAQDIGSSSSLGKFVRVPVGESIFFENVLILLFWKHILGHIACTMCS